MTVGKLLLLLFGNPDDAGSKLGEAALLSFATNITEGWGLGQYTKQVTLCAPLFIINFLLTCVKM